MDCNKTYPSQAIPWILSQLASTPGLVEQLRTFTPVTVTPGDHLMQTAARVLAMLGDKIGDALVMQTYLFVYNQLRDAEKARVEPGCDVIRQASDGVWECCIASYVKKMCPNPCDK